MEKMSESKEGSNKRDDVCYDIVFDDLKVEYDENYVLITLYKWLKSIFYYLVIVAIIIYYYAVFGYYKKTSEKRKKGDQEDNDDFENGYSDSSESD
jgi:hypothetical protein